MRKIIFLIIVFFLACCVSNKPEKFAEDIAEKNSEQIINIDMVFVKGGTFTMGCIEYCLLGGFPFHDVTLSDFYISKYLVTQKLWKDLMGTSKVSEWQYGEGDDYPVYYVSWDEAQEFIEKLNSLTGKKYRLPTEAEWEYAARGGTESKGYKYAGSDNYDEVAWYRRNSGDKILEMDSSLRAIFISPQPLMDKYESENNNRIHPVGLKKPNELGIYDMSGSLDEWAWDWYDEYSSAPQINPKGPSSGYKRIIRGGDWNGLETKVHMRTTYWQSEKTAFIGFRLAMEP